MSFSEAQERRVNSGAYGNLPNGIYRTSLSGYDEVDEKIAELTFTSETNWYINSLTDNSF